MKLVRLATVYLRPSPSQLRPIAITSSGADVSILVSGPAPEGMRLLVNAVVSLASAPPLSVEGSILVPAEPRVRAEEAIEFLSNVIAVREGVARQIRSPSLAVAFVPETKEDKQFLKDAQGIAETTKGIWGVKPHVAVDPTNLTAALQDRQDGLALLAEALSHDHAMGQFHEYLRIFERAFALGPHELVAPLTEFLVTSNMGFSEQEVTDWLGRLRHPATHADRRPQFFLEADVRPVTWRMRQGAYDVLFNKETWRDKSTARRRTWSPAAWTAGPGEDAMVARPNASFQAELQWLDQFGRYPFDLQAEIRRFLPPDWWVEQPDPEQESA